VAQSENQAANGENNINIGIDNKSFFLADEDGIIEGKSSTKAISFIVI
jgi:hypothetical protein